MAKFKGFSTVNRSRPSFKLNDVQLIKQDIMNALTTRRGERVMRPNFGTDIFDYLFEPIDDVRDLIHDEVERVLSFEPRVANPEITIREYSHGFEVKVGVDFLPDFTREQLIVRYKRDNGEDT